MKAYTDVDYLILGAGPAGLQLGYLLEEGKRNYLILEKEETAGSFFAHYPRSRNLISFNKVYSVYKDPEIQLRWDWNSLLTKDYSFLFRSYSRRLYPRAEEMMRYLEAFAQQHALTIQYGTRIVRISRKEDGTFSLEDHNQTVYTCRYLIVATGFSRVWQPAIPGIEFAEGYEDVSMNPDDFINQTVMIIGKGNSGFEFADTILSTAALVHIASPHPLLLAWNTKHPGHLRADYSRLLDTYQLKLLNSSLDCTIHKIERLGSKLIASVTYSHADGEVEELIYDRIVRCTGFQFDASIFDDTCYPDLTIHGRFPAMTSSWESTNVRNLFFAGTLMQVRDFKHTSSAFIDGFRYNIRTLSHFLTTRSHQEPYPEEIIECSSTSLAQAALKRICRSSALWAQFGFLCDVILVDEQAGVAHYYQELPVDYVHEGHLGNQKQYYTITYEWGNWAGDVFAIDRHPSNEQADKSAFLHPVVRCFSGKTVVGEHHMLEDLFGMYSHEGIINQVQSISGRSREQYHIDEHEKPLYQFFARQLHDDGTD